MRTFLLVMGVSLVAGLVVGGSVALIETGVLPPIATVGVFLVAFAAAGVVLYACLRWWQALDEAAQEAHKWAWWWGGSAGMLVGLLAFVLLRALEAQGRVTFLSETAPVGESLYNGAMAILLFQVVGYFIAWAGWWLRHR